MKKIISLFAIFAVIGLVSCGDDKTAGESQENSMEKKNLDAFHTVTKAFDTGDPSMIDSVVASDFVDHSEQGDVGRDSLKAMIVAMKATTKDAKTEIIKEVADNDYVFGWLRFTGTSDGSMGMPAGPYNMSTVEVVKFKDGKAVEHWVFMEPREMMKMMPQMPPQGDKMKMDKK